MEILLVYLPQPGFSSSTGGAKLPITNNTSISLRGGLGAGGWGPGARGLGAGGWGGTGDTPLFHCERERGRPFMAGERMPEKPCCESSESKQNRVCVCVCVCVCVRVYSCASVHIVLSCEKTGILGNAAVVAGDQKKAGKWGRD